MLTAKLATVNRKQTMKLFTIALLGVGLLGMAASSYAEDTRPSHDSNQCTDAGLALGGYDVVSYLQSDGPVVGSKDITSSHNELVYRFASAANRSLFERDPRRFLPEYRGFCAATLAMGRLACPDYTNFKIENGRLLLFELAGFTNGRTVWNSDPTRFKRRADENYERLLAPGP